MLVNIFTSKLQNNIQQQPPTSDTGSQMSTCSDRCASVTSVTATVFRTRLPDAYPDTLHNQLRRSVIQGWVPRPSPDKPTTRRTWALWINVKRSGLVISQNEHGNEWDTGVTIQKSGGNESCESLTYNYEFVNIKASIVEWFVLIIVNRRLLDFVRCPVRQMYKINVRMWFPEDYLRSVCLSFAQSTQIYLKLVNPGDPQIYI